MSNSTAFKNLFVRFPLQDQIMFAKRLATLLRAGVPILKCLKILRSQMRTAGLTRIFDTLVTDVENGKYLSAGLSKYPKIFGDFTINLVHIGETSGTLHENLEYLAEELKKKQALRRKVMGSLIYPVIIVLATLAVTSMLMFFVFPRILPVFRSLNFELPLVTKILIAVSEFILSYWFWILAVVAGFLVLFALLLRWSKFRYGVQRFILSVPIFGHLSQSYQMANVTRTLGLLLRSDVRIVQACRITANTTMNLVYRRQLHEMAEKVTGGAGFSIHMSERARLFPPIVSQMVAVGEESGNLSETLFVLAEMYEHEVDELTKNLTTILEPMLMVFMGLLVGFIAVAIITPIYEVTQHLKP